MSDDLADLLGEGIATTKEKKNTLNKSGSFLGVIQKKKSSILTENIRAITNSNEENEDTKAKKMLHDGFDNFNKEKNLKNITTEGNEKLYSKSGGNFNPPSGFDMNLRRNQTTSNFFNSNTEQLNDEGNLLNRTNNNTTLSNFGIGHSKTNENLESNKQSDLHQPKNQISNSNEQGDDDIANVYIPTLSKNSRRTRLGGNQPLSQINELNSRSGSQENKNDQKQNSKDKKIDSIDSPKSLLKFVKSSSVAANINTTNTDNNKNYVEKFEAPDNRFITDKNSSANIFNKKQDTYVSITGDYFNETNTKFNNNSKDYTFDEKRNIQDSTGKEFRKEQINTKNQHSPEDKRRYNMLLDEEKEKSKRKEQELTKFIEELKQRYRDELNSSEEKNKTIVYSLMEDIKKLRGEIDKEVQKEKERMSIIHKSELENLENIHKKNLEQQKKFFEEQNDTLKKQLQQQIEFNKLANKVELSSKQIDEILQKFYKEKESSLFTEKGSLESREKYLNDLEEKLREREKMLDQERDNIMKMRKDNELRELEKKKELQEEKVRIEKEILRLQELQNSLKTLEFNAKEKYEREKLELTQKHSELKMELDTIKNDFYQRLNDLEYSKKIFEEEKRFFEKFKDEAIKNIEMRKVNFEERKKKSYEEEKELRGRIKVLQEKEFYLKEKFDEFERVKIDVEELGKKSEKDKRELLIAAKRIEETVNNLNEKKRRFEKEKEEMIKIYQEFEGERTMINAEKIKIEQSKAELKLRLQNVDMLRIKYVSGDTTGMPVTLTNDYKPDFRSTNIDHPFSQNANSSFSITQKNNMYLTNNYLNQKISNIQNNLNNITELKLSKTLSHSSNLRKSFNADEYMQSLKFKLGDRDYLNNNKENTKNFIHQEQEYLKKSMDNYESSIKYDYDKLSQQYLNNTNKNVDVEKFNPGSTLNFKELNRFRLKEQNDETNEINSKLNDDNKNNDNFHPKEDKKVSNSILNKNIDPVPNIKLVNKKKDIFDDFDEIA